jgi:hypothetical protein
VVFRCLEWLQPIVTGVEFLLSKQAWLLTSGRDSAFMCSRWVGLALMPSSYCGKESLAKDCL